MTEHHAQVVIIGGGAVGCSIAYHLSKLGVSDVVLLEKGGLTHGATWHAAGLVGQLRSKRNLTKLMQYSAQLYDRLEAETGQATGWRPVGSLRVASSRQRWQEIKRTASTAKSFGFELELIGANEARDLFPLMTTDGVHGAAWIPTDGYIDPSSLTQAYAKGARMGGVQIVEGITVTGLEIRDRRIISVQTDKGDWSCETVVNAAGLWARQVAEMAGVSVPAGVVEHQYVVTEKSDRITDGLPTFRDPDKLSYIKPDTGCLALGGWENNTLPFAVNGMPEGFGQELLEPNFNRFEQIILKAVERVPILNELGLRTLINGPIPVSPDGEPIMGPAPELDNFFVACGFTAGIAGSGGAGKVMAEWITHGEPEYDIWNFDLRRFGSHHSATGFLSARAVENYGRYYLIHWPGEEMQTGRGLRTSPLYELLARQGAVYGSKFGWERANWFCGAGNEPKDTHSFDRTDTDWFENVGAEHRAVREGVALIDQSSFTKLELTGAGVSAALQRLCVSNMDRPVGSVIYTQMCNKKGGIECDLTVMRTDEKSYYVVTGSGFGVHDFHWISRHLTENDSVNTRELTGQYAVINICGPHSRDVLQCLTATDVSNEVFPFATCQGVELADARVLAARIGYVGELGWELHMPVEYARHVYRELRKAGQAFGISDVGYRAIDSLRMEKGYLYWSADITPDYTPYEAGLDFRVHLRSKGDFNGREALQEQRESGVKRRLSMFTIEGPPLFYGSECILHEGRVVGTTTSANYGYTVATNIAYGYLPVELVAEDEFEIEAFGHRYAARRHSGPLYDPEMKRLK